jgi:hypothetical protein
MMSEATPAMTTPSIHMMTAGSVDLGEPALVPSQLLGGRARLVFRRAGDDERVQHHRRQCLPIFADMVLGPIAFRFMEIPACGEQLGLSL